MPPLWALAVAAGGVMPTKPTPIPGFAPHGNRYRALVSLPERDALYVRAEATRRGVTPSVVMTEWIRERVPLAPTTITLTAEEADALEALLGGPQPPSEESVARMRELLNRPVPAVEWGRKARPPETR